MTEDRPDRITSRVVGANVARIRTGQGITTRSLAHAVTQLGVPLSSSGVTDIERGRRGVSVDQLTALSRALAVSPIALLTPLPRNDDPDSDPTTMVTLTGIGATDTADAVAAWLAGARPLTSDDADDFEVEAFRRRSLPWWVWKVGR